MKVSGATAAALLAASCSAWSFGSFGSQKPLASEQRLLQLSESETRWVDEDEKWALKRKGINFFDITDHQHLIASTNVGIPVARVSYPPKPAFKKEIKPYLKNLTISHMQENLGNFTSFHTRYYKSNYGAQSSAWLLQKIKDTASGYKNISINPFPHTWVQSSIIAHIPGSESNNTVVIGAHQDSVNMYFPALLPAPGADDDGSGTVTILEAFRVLVSAGFKPRNNLEFHWYSAEEGGLLGSQAIFTEYAAAKIPVVAMLQQDMTGYVKKTLAAGEKESVGVITDYVDAGLTAFIKTIIDTYCDIPYVETKCGYACSDHASASKNGYPSAFVIESEFKYSDDKIHTQNDVISELSFDHMLQHAKMTLALAYELSMAKF